MQDTNKIFNKIKKKKKKKNNNNNNNNSRKLISKEPNDSQGAGSASLTVLSKREVFGKIDSTRVRFPL